MQTQCGIKIKDKIIILKNQNWINKDFVVPCIFVCGQIRPQHQDVNEGFALENEYKLKINCKKREIQRWIN